MATLFLSKIRVPRGLSGVRHYSSGKVVGFIGLGNMGNSMASNLVKKGHSLVVFDLQPAATKSLQALGAKVGGSPAEVAAQSDTLVTMLPACPQVKGVYTGPNGIFEAAKPGTIFVDSSTIDPDTSKEMSRLASAKSHTYMDCPVSGGVVAASAGTLTFMVGGPKDTCSEVEPLLLGMGAKVVHCGPVGSGQAAKICNNMLLGISMIGVSETMNLGIRMGLDPKLLAGIINSSTGRCWSSEIYNPVPGIVDSVPSSRGYAGGFGTALITKDLGLAQKVAGASGSPTPLGSMSHQIYQLMCTHGLKDLDFSVVFKFLQDQQTKQNK